MTTRFLSSWLLARARQRAANALPTPEEYDTTRRYCERLDRLQAALFRVLGRAYGDEPFAQLLALKVCNLLAAERHFRSRHTRLVSRPAQLLIDPANGCQLRCPGCVHSANGQWSGQFDWPDAVLSLDHAAELFASFGPFACAAVLYNYGEPLVNRRFPEIVGQAKAYALFSMTSTNLALRIDPERLVACGLDRLTVSLDGVSQAAYERFRRRGQVELVMDNIVAIAEAKRRQRSPTPYLVWQYLTFEHNIGEVDAAIVQARRLGVNEIDFRTPFSVDGDDPSLTPAASRYVGRMVFEPVAPAGAARGERPRVARVACEIDAAFRKSWRERFLAGGGVEEATPPPRETCGWLYHSLTVDAARRVMPCCIAPGAARGVKNLVYARLGGGGPDVVNSGQAVRARQAFADRHGFDRAVRDLDPADLPYCARCPEQPVPPYAFDVADYVRALDTRRAIPEAVYATLRDCALYATAR